MAEAICRVTADGRRAPEGEARLLLRFRDERSGVRKIRLGEGPVRIGADPGNDVVLHDRFVSGFHCSITQEKGALVVRDLRSTNGTLVDGMRVSEAELSAGSTLRVGGQVLVIERDVQRRAAVLPGLVSRDPALAPALELLRRAAPSLLPVTLLGESGTGKEVAARAVHELSTRAAGPFVALNCGAIAHELAEAELFGHERGSFTGAVASAPGAFGAADGGTLFLDEIGDLPLSLQVKLLRALESGEVKPVGAARPRRIDVRIVCATHRDLRARVREGTFREDLYYRLRGVTVDLLPLRERPQDILPLADHFLAQVAGDAQRTLAPDARAALLAHRWPGNARELRHVIHLAVLLCDGPVLRASSLRLEGAPAPWHPHCADGPGEDGADEAHAVFGATAADNLGSVEPGPVEPYAQPALPAARAICAELPLAGRTLAALEEAAIRAAHGRHEGNRRAIADELGIARSSLLRKLDQLGLREA